LLTPLNARDRGDRRPFFLFGCRLSDAEHAWGSPRL